MSYPKYAKIKGKIYKINTDFRVAIKCNQIAEDGSINDYKRALAIICTLFGQEVIGDRKNYNELLNVAKKYLLCGEEFNEEQPDMDFIEDEEYIKSSFKYDYQYNPYNLKYCHWYEFYHDLSNLSNSELGDCCVLNRVRNIRNIKLSDIKDPQELEKAKKAKERVALKKYSKKVKPTDEQKENAKKLYEQLGIFEKR